MKLWNLKYWETGEYQVIQEHLDDYTKAKTMICPQRKDIFKALRETPYESLRVAIFGQDPYPNPAHATGLAFSVPAELRRSDWPPTLNNVVKEYMDDLHYPEPATGSLLPWAHRGVLLWNVIPTCIAFRSLSHQEWPEYHELNKEMLERIADKPEVVCVFLGGIARAYIPFCKNDYLAYSHPSPRANLSSKTPFLGSRMFTNVNDKLKETIDWRL